MSCFNEWKGGVKNKYLRKRLKNKKCLCTIGRSFSLSDFTVHLNLGGPHFRVVVVAHSPLNIAVFMGCINPPATFLQRGEGETRPPRTPLTGASPQPQASRLAVQFLKISMNNDLSAPPAGPTEPHASVARHMETAWPGRWHTPPPPENKPPKTWKSLTKWLGCRNL